MQLSRLKGRKVNDQVQRKGRIWRGSHMTIRWLPGAPRRPDTDPEAPALYVGTAASAKLDKSAVRRNRMRRRCREALRVSVRERSIPAPVQLLLSPRSSSLDCTFDALLADCEAFLTSIISHG